MPNRIIKESICTSERIAALTDLEFRLWIGLITQADDYGRGDARAAVIKGRVFPFRERITLKDIDNSLNELAVKGCIDLYEVDGKSYFLFPNWANHQRVRDCKAKYPEPDCIISRRVAASCGELPPEYNPIQSEYNTNTNTNFDVFWKAYPRKTAKEDARKAYAALMKKSDAPTIERLIESIEAHKRSEAWKKDDGQFIPHPATYIRQGRYDDEIKDKSQSGNSNMKWVNPEDIKDGRWDIWQNKE